MAKIRVLVVDDSVVVRRMISDAMAGDSALEVAATAANGRIALDKIPQVNPDLVTLDVEMPEMDGLETMAEIRRLYPRLPVIMFSTLTQRGAAATIDALSLGARDYVTKPANAGSAQEAIEKLRQELLPRIKLFCGHSPAPTRGRPVESPLLSRNWSSPAVKSSVTRVDILAIGVSTGGPNALAQLLPGLGPHCPVPIVVVQHMLPLFTRFLAERLTSQSKIPFAEGVTGQVLQPGAGWIAPGDFHMEVLRQQDGAATLRLSQGMPENSCRPSVDVLLRSAAKAFGAGVLAVVLTGMGQDGLRGCQHVHEVGGQILVQDEASSVVWGMPGAVAKASLAQEVLPLKDLSLAILRRLRRGR
jgi:two-component system chemotaxis response regulator CheB